MSGYPDFMIKHLHLLWRQPKKPSKLLAAPVGLALAGLMGCSSATTGYCQAHADCEREFLGVVLPDEAGSADDDIAVCTANKNAFLSSLRANEETVCQNAADATEVYMACIAQAFAEGDDSCDLTDPTKTKCDDELDDMNDALNKIDPGECSENEG
jgi:hypothetical protein